MSTEYKHQTEFAFELAAKWLSGEFGYVRRAIRGLKNKGQAAYIASVIAYWLPPEHILDFLDFMHPDNKD